MVIKNFNSYPIINKALMSKIGISLNRTSFTYGDGFELETEKLDNNSYSLKDEKYNWNKETDNICIHKTYKFRNPGYLFGENGIVCENAVIGIALKWYSYDSKQRGVVKFGIIENQLKTAVLTLEHEFQNAQLRGCVTFETILYVETPGSPSENELFLANKRGLYLGTVCDNENLYLDGMASIFPIYEIEDDNGPLWTVTNTCCDPTTESFSDTISINLNRIHKNYEKLRTDKDFMIECMSAALVCIISDLKINFSSIWKNIENNESLSEGSVGAAIYYFMETLNWNFDTMKELSVSIRQFLRKSILGV